MRLFTLTGLVAISMISTAQAQITPIFTTVPTSPTSDVPGLAGVKFRNSAFSSVFDRPFVSENGQNWMLQAMTNSGVISADRVVIVGSGLTAAGASTPIREGDTVPASVGVTGQDTFGTFGQYSGINNSGHYALVADVSTTVSAADNAILRWNGTSLQSVVVEGGASAILGINFSATLDAAHILENGDVRFRSTLTPTTSGAAAVFNYTSAGTGTVLAQGGVTTPTGQIVSPQTLSPSSTNAIFSNSFTSDATGSNTLYVGTLNGPPASDRILVFNGATIVQEGVPVPGSSFISNASTFAGTGQLKVSPSGGHYIVQGANADNIDWVYRNGAVVAATNNPITPGNTETWSQDSGFSATFFTTSIGRTGDYVVGGLTNNANLERNAVLVLNGTQVLVREGDFTPFDVDGNGSVSQDEGMWIKTFNDNDAFLTDTHYYFQAELVAGAPGSPEFAANSTAQAFLIVPVPEPALLLAGLLPLAAFLRRK